MTTIVSAEINQIGVNPHRRLHAFPYIDSKLEALQRSIQDVGLWPSVIAREARGSQLWRYEIAFGHHRVEAAKRLGLKEIKLILEPLSDTQMLQYMGRENLEDYNANFLIQLEAWEAALKSGIVMSNSPRGEREIQAIDIAKLLGWTTIQGERTIILNATARACHSAYSLIDGGYMAREQFTELTVHSARELAENTWARMERIDKGAAISKTPLKEVKAAKEFVGKAAAHVARQVRSGDIAPRDIRGHVGMATFNLAAKANKVGPIFRDFCNEVADSLRRTINNDADGEKLLKIEEALSQISILEDWQALRRLQMELVNLGERSERWHNRLTPTKEKVVQLRALENKGAGK